MTVMAAVRNAFSKGQLKRMIRRHVHTGRIPESVRLFTDTSDFFRIDYNDVVVLAGIPYLVRNHEREGRFGIDDEPKFWVKRAIDLKTGEVKILKLVFHENFRANVGGISFECVRSPRKEARILDLVRGHDKFMQGGAVEDDRGNLIRVLDYIRGETFADHVSAMGTDHEDFFRRHFPAVLDEFVELVKAIQFLHDNGEKHGDIRRDHIIREKKTGICRWIDFDFDYIQRENIYGYDLFGLGNILAFLAGRGDVTVQRLKTDAPEVFEKIVEDDLNIIFSNRVVNLKKVYPYLPGELNLILMHFSVGANYFYEDTGQFLRDLREAREAVPNG